VIDLPELLLSNEEPNVTICFGSVPDEITLPLYESESIQFNSNELLLKIKDVTLYVANGNCITIDKNSLASIERIKLFVLGTGMGTLLHQRGFLPIHGSAVLSSKGSVIITGDSGAGKSTTAWSLSTEGYKVMSDDICAIDLINGKPMLISAYPQLRLWENAAEGIDITRKNEMAAEPGKFFISAMDIFYKLSAEISFIFVLKKHAGSNLIMSKVKGLDKFKHLSENTYRPFMVKGIPVIKNHFKLASLLGASTEIYVIERPEKVETMNEIKELIIKTINI